MTSWRTLGALAACLLPLGLTAKADPHGSDQEASHATAASAHSELEAGHAEATAHAHASDKSPHQGPEIVAVPSDPIPFVELTASAWKVPARDSSVDPVTSGSPNFVHFPTEIFGGARDFRGVAQHRDGRIYVIVGPHLYVGTGTRWQRLPRGPAGELSSLFLARSGRLYLASTEDFGYLDLSEGGDPAWNSIRDDFPDEKMQGRIWKPSFEDEGGRIYFISGSTIVAHDGVNPLRMWRNIEDPEQVYSLHGDVFALTKDLKLYRLEANGRSEIVQRDLPIKYGDIRNFAPFDEDHVLVAAGSGGLALFDGDEFKPFELDEFEGTKLVADQLVPLGKDVFAVVDYENGLLIFRSDGTLLRQVQRVGGLKIRIAKALSIDRQGWMWLAHPSGLYRLNIASQGMSFDHHEGLEGKVNVICEHDHAFYVGTSVGLFRWNGVEFSQIEGVPAVDSLVSSSEGLGIGTQNGFYVHHQERTYLVDKGARPYVFQSSKAPELLLTPTSEGIDAYNLFSHRWRPASDWSRVPTSGLGVVADTDGGLWGEYGPGRMAYYDFPAGEGAPEVFTPKHGLPLAKVVPFRLGDEVFFVAGGDVLRFLPKRNGFSRSEGWKELGHVPGSQPAQRAIQDPQGGLWVPESKLQNRYIQFPPRGLEGVLDDVLVYGQDPLTLASLDHAGHLWVGNSHGLRRYIRGMHASEQKSTPVTLIHRIEAGGEVIADFASGTTKVMLQGLDAKTKALRITYSVLEYDEPSGVTYSTKLEGYNEAWQPFTEESIKEYSSLAPGEYSFHVLAQTVDGREASPAVVEFSIPERFADTLGAKAIGVIVVIGLLAGLLMFLRRAASRKIRKLEETLSQLQSDSSKSIEELDVKAGLLAKSIAAKKKLKDEKDALLSKYEAWLLDLSQQIRPSATMISQLSGNLSSEGLGEEGSRLLRGLRLTSESLVGGIRDLLDLRNARLEAIQEDEVSYDLQDVLDDVLETVAAGANGRGIELISQIEKGVKPRRVGNPARVVEVVTPLVVAALTQAEVGEVRLIAMPAEGQSSDFVCFGVRAKGQLWDDEMKGQLLSSTDPALPPSYRGRAQGIALARHLMKPMQGIFDLFGDDSQTFGYNLALFQPPVEDESSTNSDERPFADRVLLIVDDNPHALKGLEALAERSGFQVRLANEGPQAQKALIEEPRPDLIWMDAELAEEDGYAVLETIRSTEGFEAIPAMILTTSLESGKGTNAAKNPHSLLVAKPARKLILEAGCDALLYPDGRGGVKAAVSEEAADAREGTTADDAPAEDEDPIEAKIRAALAKSEAQSAGVDSAADEAKSTGPESVLLVDTHRARAETTKRVLKHFKKGVKVVQEAGEVLSSLENGSYELVLLTHPLNDSEVSQLTRQIRELLPEDRHPVIVSMGADYPEGSVEAGIDDHLRLPLSVSALGLVLRLAGKRHR